MHFNIVLKYTKFISATQSRIFGGKFELQEGTVGVCSSYKRSGQPAYNLPAAHFRFTP